MKAAILNICLVLLYPAVTFLPLKTAVPNTSSIPVAGKFLFRSIQDNGGFTYQPLLQKTPKIGYAVAIFPHAEKVFDLSKFTEADIHAYLQQHREKFRNANVHVGGWVDQGKVYLDLSCVVQDREEALRLGAHHGQQAIFHLDKMENISVPDNSLN